ncbi:type I-E CRISPR-associated protein Cas5/CasD [Pararhodospirillum oryzae]|uniref:Type I-E CRISPR-associated protein Cas5/CasD n=1 Tax=Pararhodospirillum oryzae TaxID=478448 RepID=A0A512H973_9PROT|nr:type I-E CRISPR-associated protein Cas5/CasD [Pararhodospirillum oryzae]GEO82009.1 type I-E CRISPR-associated protein Cas5/CasD [Pararhodospirillum oryzae]
MPEPRWLIMHLEAPMLAFGGATIDQVGVIRPWPALSMLTGLLGNALGWRRTDTTLHQGLQDRLVIAARRDRPGTSLTDTQNVRLDKADKGWTTWGEPEGRAGDSYDGPHRRVRDYWVDACVVVALRVDGENAPDLDTLAAALDRPARPVFLGRKSCLPSAPLRRLRAFEQAATAHQALSQVPRTAGAGPDRLPAVWPLGEGPDTGQGVLRIIDLPDRRDWSSGLHGGSRRVVEGFVVPPGDTP